MVEIRGFSFQIVNDNDHRIKDKGFIRIPACSPFWKLEICLILDYYTDINFIWVTCLRIFFENTGTSTQVVGSIDLTP